MEISYSDLRVKEVVNLQNGVRMGKIIDMIVDCNGKNVLGLVVPGVHKLFKANEDIFIPWCNIAKIGSDVILVNLDMSSLTNVTRSADVGSGCQERNKSASEDFL